MLSNRSMPACAVIPVLGYDDVGEAIDWLCDAFGFTERWRAGNHRAQLAVGDAAVAVTEGRGGGGSFSVMVRVEDVDGHHERARQRGARILQPPADYPYGERQYTAADPAGHVWTFSQSIADVAPEEWGGKSGSFCVSSGMTLRRGGAMGECEARTQVSFLSGGYGQDRGRRIAPPSVPPRHKTSFR